MKNLLAPLTLAAALTATSAGAATFIPISSDPGGQSAKTSAEQYWQWIMSFDRVVDGGDPVNDDTGALQTKKQSYPVFMVAGGINPGVQFTARAGKPFMLNLVNSVCVGGLDTAPVPANIPCKGQDQENAQEFLNTVDRLVLKVDDRTFIDANSRAEVKAIEEDFRIQTRIYSVDVAPNNWITSLGFPLPGGIYPSSFNYGYYAFLDLPVGTHMVEYGGGSPSGVSGIGKVQITVAPVPIPAALPLFAAGLAALGFVARRRGAQI